VERATGPFSAATCRRVERTTLLAIEWVVVRTAVGLVARSTRNSAHRYGLAWPRLDQDSSAGMIENLKLPRIHAWPMGQFSILNSQFSIGFGLQGLTRAIARMSWMTVLGRLLHGKHSGRLEACPTMLAAQARPGCAA
jgi:hypothetical protein